MAEKPTDRRRSQRHRRRLDVRFWNDRMEGRGFTTNVSNKGMLIETSKTLQRGERFHLEIRLPEASFFAEGVIVRRKAYPPHARSMYKPCVAVRFVGLREVIRSITAGQPAPDEGLLKVDLSEPAKLAQVYERDIRYGGLLVHAEERPELDSEVVVRVVLPAPHGQIECRGIVVKLTDDPPMVALRLTEVDQVRGRMIEIIRSS